MRTKLKETLFSISSANILLFFSRSNLFAIDQRIDRTMTDKFEALGNVRKWLESTAAGSISLAASDPKVTTAFASDCARDTIRTMLEQHYHCVPIVGSPTVGTHAVSNVLTLQDVVAGESK
jgi:hypothetical protein